VCNGDGLLNAINQYIIKADDDLLEKLKEAGYAAPHKTIEFINSLEDELQKILAEDIDGFEKLLNTSIDEDMDLDDFISSVWEEYKENSAVSSKLKSVLNTTYTAFIPEFANTYLKDMDSELIADVITKRTTAWIDSWSGELSELMGLSSHNKIDKLLRDTLTDGNGIGSLTAEILDSNIRTEIYTSRRVAVTEILRAHSVSHEESIQQSPAVESKEWMHSGSYKIAPRQNHINMSGQIVPKNEPFVLSGADGSTYYPMYPRDSCLPAGEAINCHCFHRGIVNEEIMGMPLEKRRKLQEEAIKQLDDEWEKELDVKNKARAGIET